MGTLILLRHAKAEPAAPGMRDFDRPLEARGRHDAGWAGHRLRALTLRPDAVLCSAARRTRETLDDLGLELKTDAVTFSRSLFEADGAGYLPEIQAMRGTVLLVVGHNPAISDCARMLADAAGDLPNDFATAGFAVLDFGGEPASLRAKSCRATRYEQPPKR